MFRSGRPAHDRLKGGQRERQRLTEADAVTAVRSSRPNASTGPRLFVRR
jgi:hypothetical protein